MEWTHLVAVCCVLPAWFVCNSVPVKRAPCQDQNEQCASWAASGECSNNPGYMLHSCQVSCKSCASCEDGDPQCASWAASGECNANPGYMLGHCPASCNVTCEDGNPSVDASCTDNNEQCSQWASTGECLTNPTFMLENCPRSCDTCGIHIVG